MRTGRPPGPPPTPTALRLVKGNPGRRPLPKDEPKPAAKVPRKPSWIKGAAASEWKRVASELAALGLLTELDRWALVCYCRAYQAAVDLELEIDKEGWFVPTENGGKKRNPAAASLNEAWHRVHAAAAELGMTPAARTRISTPGASKEDDFDRKAKRRRTG